jgi:hypothetical protein
VLEEWERGIRLWAAGDAESEIWLEAALKRRIFEEYLKSVGVTWEQARVWRHVLASIRASGGGGGGAIDRMHAGGARRAGGARHAGGARRAGGARGAGGGGDVGGADDAGELPEAATLLAGLTGIPRSGPPPDSRKLPRGLRRALGVLLQQIGCSWRDERRYRELVERLDVLDIELSRIEGGIADRQSRWRREMGVEVLDEIDVRRLVTEPPARTRARARGRLIQRHFADAGLCCCWDRLATTAKSYVLGSPVGWRMPRGRTIAPAEPDRDESGSELPF